MAFYNFNFSESDEALFQLPLPALTELELTRESPEYLYISQDNFIITKFNTEKPVRLYCDSATSCIIIIAVGKNTSGELSVIMSHLSRPGRFKTFFDLVDSYFPSEVKVYAAGANPPQPILIKKTGKLDHTALRNALQVSSWAGNKTMPQDGVKKVISTLSLRFGQGDPSVKSNNLDCMGITIGTDAAHVENYISNQRIELKQSERDPLGGVQTLFCIYGEPNVIQNANVKFTKTEIDRWVTSAKEAGMEKAMDMTDEEILNTYSSTPDYEVEWFCESIRQAANYVKNYQF